MRNIIPLAISFILTVTFPSVLQAQSKSLQDLAGGLASHSETTTIYSAKEFITMNSNQPRVEAVAVKEGKFVAIGTLDEVKKAVGKDAKIDQTFDGKVVIAGFVEQHVHPVLAALTMNTKVISIEDWDTIDGFSPAVRDEQGYQRRLAEAVGAHADKSAPFISWGYHHYFHGDLSRPALDKLAPDEC
jgi:predicted amidohydrolase YtcJ